MLGPPKPRRLDVPIAVWLEDLVPRGHFYRHLEAREPGIARMVTRLGSFDPCARCLAPRSMEQVDMSLVLRFTADDAARVVAA